MFINWLWIIETCYTYHWCSGTLLHFALKFLRYPKLSLKPSSYTLGWSFVYLRWVPQAWRSWFHLLKWLSRMAQTSCSRRFCHSSCQYLPRLSSEPIPRCQCRYLQIFIPLYSRLWPCSLEIRVWPELRIGCTWMDCGWRRWIHSCLAYSSCLQVS